MIKKAERHVSIYLPAAICALLIAVTCQSGSAATLCVGTGTGCVATIGAAVTAASAGDTIQVGAGTYKEVVTITKPLALIGAGSATTIIDATGLANGIVIDGSKATGLSNVVVSGFTVMNANLQGILAENVSFVTILSNQVLNNDKSLNIASSPSPTCPGLPAAFQQGEGEDCGEGIHLSGVDHSVVSNNVVQNNSGGILISDDTGASHDNVISGNLVSNNPYDCGITLPSHSGMGVYHNTVTGNQSSNNGNKYPGAGAGVGIFAPGPGSKAYGNVVVNNQLTGNGQPGVTMHNHASVKGAPAVVFDDNVIVGNTISGNAADTGDAATPGPTGINIFSLAPMHGTVISQNVISQEAVGIVINAPGSAVASLNNIAAGIGLSNSGGGTVSAGQNWWGGICPTGPNTGGCEVVQGSGVTFTPWLTSPFSATQLPAAPTTTTPGGGGNAVTISVLGPGGATATNNSFQTLAVQVTMDASQSTSTNPGTLSYSWTPSPGFPISGITGGSTATPTFQFPGPGTYQYMLTVTDSTGATASATVTVQYI